MKPILSREFLTLSFIENTELPGQYEISYTIDLEDKYVIDTQSIGMITIKDNPPTGSISIMNHIWDQFIQTTHFDIFNKDKLEVYIYATDKEADYELNVEYLINREPLDETHLLSRQDWIWIPNIYTFEVSYHPLGVIDSMEQSGIASTILTIHVFDIGSNPTLYDGVLHVQYGDQPLDLNAGLEGVLGSSPITWTSSHPELVSVDQDSGMASFHHATHEPRVIISATQRSDGLYADAIATAVVTVSPMEVVVQANQELVGAGSVFGSGEGSLVTLGFILLILSDFRSKRSKTQK